ncbi:cellulase family glycosylhydrolase [Mycobacterium sp. M26]|uniref:cellulase family glycosylhydrolase n=1 Tax=Mycobacterium sp. M26 TaxID=1762962 RepID=UPI001E2F3CE8|nr:cellulase family glycosylhydrolase [Mycobacterium sp. M26]
MAVALGTCLALSTPTTAFADSTDSGSSSTSVGHSKRAAGTATAARSRSAGKSVATVRVPIVRPSATVSSSSARVRASVADDGSLVIEQTTVTTATAAPRTPQPATAAAVATTASASATVAARTMNPIESVISGVLSVFGFNPDTDPDLSFGMAVLAWVRREFEHTLFNRAPTVSYDQTTNSLTSGGAITGNVGAGDPEGDPLTYRIDKQAASGIVTIDADGTFVYTPNAPMQPGQTDRFVVAVADTGLHLHGIDSLLSPQTAGTTTATITVAAIDANRPQLSISDAAVTETNSGRTPLTFTVTLSKVSTGTVTVAYSTVAGTATAGVDFTAATGTLTFAAGETTKVISVAAVGDTVVEPDETFTVTLSNAAGAGIADATATGTIRNDDTATQNPGLSISDASATEPGGSAVGAGYWHTDGNQILDAAGNPVEIAGVNWFGFESDVGTPHGLWTRSYKDMMDQMVALGFNTIRLPYSQDVLHGQMPSSINYAANPDLQGLSSIQVMDKIIAYADEVGLKVILDHHRNTAGVGTTENGLWYNGTYSETDWVNDWVTLAQRYAGNPTVIGVDLHNEPYNGTWGGGGTNDWARAAERAGNAVLAVNPNLLIIVEGVGTYNNQNYWWGGNLMGVKDRPISLNVANRVVYSPHDYPNSVYAQTWFSGDNFGAALPGVFENAWGYIYEDDIAPIYLGEFGTKLTDPKDIIWYEAITSYLSGDFDNNGTIDIAAGDEGISWTYWSWNPNSGDTGGILADDWRTVNQNKVTYLKPIMFDLGDAAGTSVAQFTVTLAAPSSQTVTVQYATVGQTATQGSDYVGASGTVTFQPGETSKTVTIVILGDSLAENSETFTVVLSSPTNATLADATGVGTIVNA